MADLLDTERLGAQLRDLASGVPDSGDPVAAVLGRVRRRRIRQRLGASALIGAIAASGLLLVPYVSENLPGHAADIGFASGATPPPPWSDRIATGDDFVGIDSPYVVAEGTVAGLGWTAASTDMDIVELRGCLVTSEWKLFGRPFVCYDNWAAGRASKWNAERANGDTEATLVFGAVGPEARTVRIAIRDQADTVVPAVATPTSPDLRFFATVLLDADVHVENVTPLDANGEPAAPPPGLPWEQQGGECGKTAHDDPGEQYLSDCPTRATRAATQ